MIWKKLLNDWEIKLLSFLLSAILWAGIAGGRTVEVDFKVPLEVRNLPPGFSIASPVPSDMAVTIAGPRILLLKLKVEKIIMPLDARGLGEGVTVFSGFEQRLGLPRGVSVTRLHPAVVELRLVRSPDGLNRQPLSSQE